LNQLFKKYLVSKFNFRSNNLDDMGFFSLA
jgi:hypothetical protein